MPVFAHISHSYEQLLDALLYEMEKQQKHSGSPQQTTIVVPSHRVAHWITQSIADHWGVCVNVRFVYLSSLLESVNSSGLEPTTYDQLPLQWTLHLKKLLEEKHQQSKSNSIKDIQQAKEYAELFLHYFEHRPGWMGSGKIGDLNHHANKFQTQLYSDLRNSREISQHPLNLMEPSNEAQFDFAQNLHVFGFWEFSPLYWNLLCKISEQTEVFAYLSVPTAGYIVDLTPTNLRNPELTLLPENPTPQKPTDQLLAKLGQRGRATQIVLLDENIHCAERFDHPQTNETSLERLKTSILDSDTSTTDRPPLDESIQLHGCSSKIREIEIAKDLIYQVFQQVEGLRLEDIQVCAPNIDEYTHLIPVVFDSYTSNHTLRYSIQNPLPPDRIPVFQSVLKLLDLSQSSWERDDVIDWLRIEPISKVFELEPEELTIISGWLDLAGIFRGRDRTAASYFDWHAGMDRLIQYYTTNDPKNEKTGPKDHHPSLHPELFDKWMRCLHFLENSTSQLDFPQHFPWRLEAILTSICDTLFTEEYAFEKQALLKTLADITAASPENWEIDVTAYRYLLKTNLPSLPPPSLLARNSGILFSSINYQDLVPCKVRILIGMNDDTFPSSQLPKSHDLITKSDSLPTDPSVKDEQRYWLLQSVMQTTTRWIAIYRDRDEKTEEPLLLSPAVHAVAECVETVFETGGNQNFWKVHHARFAYDPRYFDPKSSFTSYSEKDFNIVQKLTNSQHSHHPRSSKPVENWMENLSVHKLINFFQHPSRYYCNHHFGAKIETPADFSKSHEPLLWMSETGTEFRTQQELLRKLAEGSGPEESEKLLQKYHALPEAGMSRFYSDLRLHTFSHAEKANTGEGTLFDISDFEPYNINLENDTILKGIRAKSSPPNPIIFSRASTLKTAHKITVWIASLSIWADCPVENRPTVVLLTKNKAWQIHPPNDPIKHLNELAGLYQSSAISPLPFFPETSLRFVQSKLSLDEIAYCDEWTREQTGEKWDLYHQRLFAAPFDSSFADVSTHILGPLIETTVSNRKGGSS